MKHAALLEELEALFITAARMWESPVYPGERAVWYFNREAAKILERRGK